MSLELLVMRHAKSGWKVPLPDHERPLNKRGERAAMRMGRELHARGWLPERILSSDAVRTRETLHWMEHALQHDLPHDFQARLYLAGVRTLRQAVAERTELRVLVLAHNPGVSSFVGWLTGVDVDMTTANIARVCFTETTWASAMAEPGLGTLDVLLQPRVLPPLES